MTYPEFKNKFYDKNGKDNGWNEDYTNLTGWEL